MAPNLSSLIVFRFLTGIGGSGCACLGGGVIADLFYEHRRGVATSFWTFAPISGPIIGPICGGFIAQRLGWRWVFWVLFIASTILTIGIECLNRETNPQFLIQQKVKRLRRELQRPDLKNYYDSSSSLDITTSLGTSKPVAFPVYRILSTIFYASLRPLEMLFLSPIVFLLSLYMSLIYGLYYLLLTTLTTVLQYTYSWSPELTGLAYIFRWEVDLLRVF